MSSIGVNNVYDILAPIHNSNKDISLIKKDAIGDNGHCPRRVIFFLSDMSSFIDHKDTLKDIIYNRCNNEDEDDKKDITTSTDSTSYNNKAATCEVTMYISFSDAEFRSYVSTTTKSSMMEGEAMTLTSICKDFNDYMRLCNIPVTIDIKFFPLHYCTLLR